MKHLYLSLPVERKSIVTGRGVYPTLFKLGYNKGKFLGFYIPIIFFGILFGVCYTFMIVPENNLRILDILRFASEHILSVSGGVLFISILLLGISYSISIRVYRKRDF